MTAKALRAREDPRFEAIEAEMAAFTSLHGSRRPPNWPQIAQWSQELLDEASPDLLVAAWLGLAWTETQGLLGLADGLRLLANLSKARWEDLAPPIHKPKARAAVVAWFAERAALWLENRQPESLSDLDAALAELKGLSEALTGALAEVGELGLSALKTPLEALKARSLGLPAAAPASGPTAQRVAGPQGPAQAAGQAKGPGEEPPAGPTLIPAPGLGQAGPAGAPPPVAAELKTMALNLAQTLLESDPHSPTSYVLRRWALWSLLKNKPPISQGRLPLPGPPGHLLSSLTKMAASQPTQALLEIEREATIHIYSLDLNCLAAQALAALGPAGDRARWALEGAVKGLLGPWPELIAAQFEDGPPLAGPTALAWIAGLMGAAAGPSRDQGKTAKKGEKAEKAEKAEKGEKNPKDRPKTAKSFLSSWPGPPPGEEEDDQPEDDRPQAGPATLTWIAGILSSPTGPTGQNDAIANPTWPPAPATPRPGTDQALLELAWESPDQGEVALKAPMDGPATEKSAVAKFLEKDWDDRHDPNRPTASVKDLEALRALGKKLRQSTGARSKLKAYVEVLNQFGHFPALTEAIGRKTLDLVDKYKVREYDPSLAVKALVAVRKASLAHLGDGPDRAPFFKALAEGAQRKLIPLSPYLALTELSDFR